MSSGDWNDEFTELVEAFPRLVQQGSGELSVEAPEEIGQTTTAPADTDSTAARLDSEQGAAARRESIAATLVRLGFISADHAVPDNPAVAVLAELLPLGAEVELCLTCHKFSCRGPYEFAHATGAFPDVATFAWGSGISDAPRELAKGPRRELVVCTQDALYWTQSRALSKGRDSVTLYSLPFSDILGATVRHRREGVVDVYIDDGPTMSFRVDRDVADALQAHVDQAAQSG